MHLWWSSRLRSHVFKRRSKNVGKIYNMFFFGANYPTGCYLSLYILQFFENFHTNCTFRWKCAVACKLDQKVIEQCVSSGDGAKQCDGFYKIISDAKTKRTNAEIEAGVSFNSSGGLTLNTNWDFGFSFFPCHFSENWRCYGWFHFRGMQLPKSSQFEMWCWL